MRLFEIPSSLLYLIAITCSSSLASAAVLIHEGYSPRAENNLLVERQCANPCGFYGQVCCGPNEACYTDANNQATCGPAAGGVTPAAASQGNWQYYTTTYVETDLNTITTTFSSFLPSLRRTSSPPQQPRPIADILSAKHRVAVHAARRDNIA